MIVLDASALIALLNEEAGSDRVADALAEEAVIGTVNLTEVVSKFIDVGWTEAAVRDDVARTSISFASFDVETAYEAGLLRPLTRHLGLSLGDRACLALAQRRGASVLTADRAWLGLKVGVHIEVIR